MSSQAPNNSDTRFLMHFEHDLSDYAAGGSTPKIITVGGVRSNAESKFGQYSLLCYGRDNNLKVHPHIDFQFGTSTWYVDAWFKFIDGEPFIFGWWFDNDNYLGIVFHRLSGTTGYFEVRYRLNGQDVGTPDANPYSQVVMDGAWHHFAVTRYSPTQLVIAAGGDFQLSKGGLLIAATQRFDLNRWPLYFGRSPRFGADDFGDFHGYIDEAHVQNSALSAGILGGVSYSVPNEQYLMRVTRSGLGVHHLAYQVVIGGSGTHLLGGTQVQMDGPGSYHLHRAAQIDGPGQHHVRRSMQFDGPGESSLGLTSPGQLRTARINGLGRHNVYDAVQIDGPGKYTMLTTTIQIDGPGSYHLRRAAQIDGPGQHNIRSAIQADGAGIHAIKESGDKYHLWYKRAGLPDLTLPATQTSPTLPFSTVALAGLGKWYFVLRERNEFGLFSQNQNAFIIELDSSNNEILLRPSDPDTFNFVATENFSTLVTAEYNYLADGEGLSPGEHSADAWLIYWTTNGVDPDPDVDVPTVVSMAKSDGVAKLSWSVSHGGLVLVKAIVRTRRTGERDSTSTTIKLLWTTGTGPTAPSLAVTHTLLEAGVKIA